MSDTEVGWMIAVGCSGETSTSEGCSAGVDSRSLTSPATCSVDDVSSTTSNVAKVEESVIVSSFSSSTAVVDGTSSCSISVGTVSIVGVSTTAVAKLVS